MTRLQDMPVVYEYSDVFSDNWSGLEFDIAVMSGIESISMMPYRMAPTVLKE